MTKREVFVRGITWRAAVLTLLIPLLAHAGEREKFDFAMKRGLSPEAGPRGAFEVEGNVLRGDIRVGRFRFSVEARPGGEDHGDGPIWHVEELLELGEGDRLEKQSFSASLDHELTLLGCRAVFEDESGRRVRAWRRYDDGYWIERQDPGDEIGTSDRRHLSTFAVPGIAALLVFLREYMPHAETYDILLLVPDYDRFEDPSVTKEGRLLMQGRGPWRGGEAYLAQIETADATWTVALDWPQRRLLGLELAREGEETLHLRPDAATEAYPPISPLAIAPTTPESALFCAVLAIQTGDLALLDASVHWESIWEALRAAGASDPSVPRVPPTVAAFREEMLEDLVRPRRLEHSRARMERHLEERLAKAQSELVSEDEAYVWESNWPSGERARVVRGEGKWRLAEFPRASLRGSPSATSDKASGEDPLSTPRGSLQHQLVLLQRSELEQLRECFTSRVKDRITAEMVAAAQKEAKGLTLEDIWASAEESPDRVEITMPNGRTLTSLLRVEGRWLSNTIWFR